MTNSCVWLCAWMCALGVWVMIHGCTEAATYQPQERLWAHQSYLLGLTRTHVHTQHKILFLTSTPPDHLSVRVSVCAALFYLVGLRWRWWRMWPRPVLRRSAPPPVACTRWWRWGWSAGTAGWSWTANAPPDSTPHPTPPTTTCSLRGGGHSPD